MINGKTLCLYLGVWVALIDCAAAQEAARPPKALSPEQIRSVQFVGRAVLGAKNSFTEDPEQSRLRAVVEELRTSLEALNRVDDRAPTRRIERRGSAQPANPERGDDELADDAPKIRALRASADTLRAQRGRLQQSIGRLGEQHPHRDLSESAVHTVAELEESLQAALQSPKESRRLRLNHLRERLAISPLKGVSGEATPSISTLAEHRN